jgi:TonB-dependent receptor
LNYRFRYTDVDFTTNFMNSLIADGSATAQDTRGNYWEVTEEITALYAMATSQFSWGSLVYGARVEQLDNSGEAWASFPTGLQLVQVSSDDTLVYPSAHLNWNLTDEVKVRFGVTTSASRPDFDDLRPNFTINDASQTISGGNPAAKPERQTGVDAYLEWYMPTGDYFSAGVFRKNLRDVLVQQANPFGLDTLDDVALQLILILKPFTLHHTLGKRRFLPLCLWRLITANMNELAWEDLADFIKDILDVLKCLFLRRENIALYAPLVHNTR